MSAGKNSTESKGKESCAWYRKCSGCDLMHEIYPRQLTLKKKWVWDCIKEFSNDEQLLSLEPSPTPFGYRSSVKLCLHEKKPEPRKIGLYTMASKNVLAIPQCPVQDAAINRLLQTLFPIGEPKIPFYEHGREAFQEGRLKFVTVRMNSSATAFGIIVSHTGIDVAGLRLWLEAVKLPGVVSVYASRLQKSDGDMVLGQQFEHVAGPETIPFRVGVAEFDLPPMAFFQANRLLLDKFVGEVVSASSATASGESLLDLYGGCGAYAAQVQDKFAQVYVVDGNNYAIEGGRRYFQNAGLSRVTLSNSYVEQFLDKLPQVSRQKITHVISNPPRGGMSIDVLRLLQRNHLPNLKYVTFVSCALSSLKKNLQFLRTKRAFSIERVVAFDMFPQTQHVETIVHLKFKD